MTIACHYAAPHSNRSEVVAGKLGDSSSTVIPRTNAGLLENVT
jgi:hypothetical protein